MRDDTELHAEHEAPSVDASARPRVGVSACLLGEAVRHDGSHRRDRWLVEVVGPHFEWVPVCPEAEAGFGVPRPTVRLLLDAAGAARMVRSDDGADVTAWMASFAERRVPELVDLGLDGYVWKKASPSCGLERVKVARPGSRQPVDGRGLFAAAVGESMPRLAMEEEGRLRDAALSEHFFIRVFAAHRLRRLLEREPEPRSLVRFHARHKYLLLAHDPQSASHLGSLVARAGVEWSRVGSEYPVGFEKALARPATRGRHVNVLEHLMGAINGISSTERARLHESVAEYRAGMVPLIVPVSLLRQSLVEHDASRSWASNQVYLDPYPRELGLRNAV